jgi:hypothetical protein
MSRPSPSPQTNRGATANGTPNSSLPYCPDISTEAVSDLQAEKLRRLYSFCHATACTIANLAFSVAR